MTAETISTSIMDKSARYTLEWKVHWLFRLAVFCEFVGHGAFGVLTKQAWVPYFGMFGIPDSWAWKLMPVVGSVDIALGTLALVAPIRAGLLYMGCWGLFTASLRPLAGEGWWEFLERSYNFGVPLLMLWVHSIGIRRPPWFTVITEVPRFTVARAQTAQLALRGIMAGMLIGHGGFGLIMGKHNLLQFYEAAGLGVLGVPLPTVRAVIGGFEMLLGVLCLQVMGTAFFVFVCAWKLATELLYVPARAYGAWWEVIERGSSYAAPLLWIGFRQVLTGHGVTPQGLIPRRWLGVVGEGYHRLHAYLLSSDPPYRGAVPHRSRRRLARKTEVSEAPRPTLEGRIIMVTHKWHSLLLVVMTLVLLGVMALPASGEVVSDGPKVGQWKTWVLASGTEIPVPAPPAETSDQTTTELAELRQLQKERSPSANTAIQYYNAVPATQRWHDLAFMLARAEKQSPNRQARLAAILHTALHDAVIVTWTAKYQFNRKSPNQMAPDVTQVAIIAGEVSTPGPSYPSEHAAIAGTAVGILTAFFPKEEANLKAIAAELGQTRLLMGVNYRSDIDAGFALGQAVAQQALARAATDGSDAKWTGTIPTGPGMWAGKDPLEPLLGTWKPWLMTRGDQFRPGPPPAVGSPEFQEELALLKRINSSPTPSQRAIATNFAAKSLDFTWEPGYALVRRGRLSVPREVRLLAPIAALQLDAYIAAHDAKYTYWSLRPNMADPTIVPLITVPNHPAYVSNAAIIASAVAELVGSMFPQDAAQWRYLGEEAGLSRIYAGIHYPSDERAGNQMGKSIAALAIQRDQRNGP